MSRTIADLRTVADYQFGRGAGEALFPDDGDLTVERSTGGRPRQVRLDGDRVVSYGVDGRFTLGIEGGRRIRDTFGPPTGRVRLGAESEPYVAAGRNAFAKFVREVDPVVRPGDEVVVVGDADDLLAVGRAELGADGMTDFETGVAVSVREGTVSEVRTER